MWKLIDKKQQNFTFFPSFFTILCMLNCIEIAIHQQYMLRTVMWHATMKVLKFLWSHTVLVCWMRRIECIIKNVQQNPSSSSSSSSTTMIDDTFLTFFYYCSFSIDSMSKNCKESSVVVVNEANKKIMIEVKKQKRQKWMKRKEKLGHFVSR